MDLLRVVDSARRAAVTSALRSAPALDTDGGDHLPAKRVGDDDARICLLLGALRIVGEEDEDGARLNPGSAPADKQAIWVGTFE